MDYVNLGQEISLRGSRSGVDEVTGSLRMTAVRNKKIDGVFYYFLMMCGEVFVFLKINDRIR